MKQDFESEFIFTKVVLLNEGRKPAMRSNFCRNAKLNLEICLEIKRMYNRLVLIIREEYFAS